MATEQQVPKIASVLVEHQAGFGEFTTEDGQWVIQNAVEAIGLFVEAVKNRAKEAVVGFFRSLGLTATIPATTGAKTIAQAKDLFTGYIDPDFKNWGLDVAGEAKPETKVESLELAKNGTFNELFTSLGDLDKRVMTDEQIIWLVQNRPDMLILDGATNSFLMKKGNEFFVASVFRYGGELGVHVGQLSRDRVWRAEHRPWLIVPQL